MPKAPSILRLCKDPAKATVGKFYEFKNATDTSVDLYFYGDIVSDWWGAWQEEDQYPEAIKNFLAEAGGKDLNIYINSGGGSVFAGIAIYNMLKRYTGKKTVYVDALAGSIASVIAFADSDMPTIPSNTKDWTHDQRSSRTSVITGLNGYSVYNKKHYQLTHLLEKGHQLRKGGRKVGNVKAFEHIAPVNETLGDLAVSKIRQKVRG